MKSFQFECFFFWCVCLALPKNARVGALWFDYRAEIQFNLNFDNPTRARLVAAVEKMRQFPVPQFVTYTKEAVDKAMSSMFDVHSNAQRAKMLFLITDGNPTTGHSPCSLSEDLKKKGFCF